MNKGQSVKKELVEWIQSIAIAVVLAMVIRTFIFEPTLVEGPSMQPTLHSGERLLVMKIQYLFHKPERGDIIVCKYPNREGNYIKRVVALENEVVEISGGKVYINGEVLEEDYIKEPPLADMEAVKVPPGSLFVMGDNRNNSMDSRDSTVGPILLSMVKGKANTVIWPIYNIHWLYE